MFFFLDYKLYLKSSQLISYSVYFRCLQKEGEMLVFLSLLLASFAIFYLWFNRRYKYWKDLGFPQYGPVEFPFGNLKGVGTNKHLAVLGQELYERFKKKAKAVGFYMYFSPVLYIVDLDLIKNILIKDFNSFVDRGTYFNAKSDPLTAHLFSVHGDYWRTLRIKMTPTFTSGKMKMMFNAVLEISNNMVRHAEKNVGEIDIKETLARFTTDVIGDVAFGLDLKCMETPDSKFREVGKKVFNFSAFNFLKIFFLAANWKFTKHIGFRVFPKDISDFFMNTVKQAIDYREANNVKRNDFLNLMIQLKNKGKIDDDETLIGKLTFNEVAAQCFLFFNAGFETSSSAMTFCLYELAQNQEVQDKLREEIKNVLESHNGEITYEAINEMTYLQMTLDGKFLFH